MILCSTCKYAEALLPNAKCTPCLREPGPGYPNFTPADPKVDVVIGAPSAFVLRIDADLIPANPWPPRT
jgi:hypothetical protein